MRSNDIKREIEREQNNLKQKEDYIRRYSSDIQRCQKIIDNKLKEMGNTKSDATMKNCQHEIDHQTKIISDKQEYLTRYQKDAKEIQAKLNKLNADYLDAINRENEVALKRQKEEQERQTRLLQQEKDRQQRELQRQKEAQDRESERLRKELESQEKIAKRQSNSLENAAKQQKSIQNQKSKDDVGNNSGYDNHSNGDSVGCLKVCAAFIIMLVVVGLALLAISLVVGHFTKDSRSSTSPYMSEQSSNQQNGEDVIGFAEVLVNELYVRNVPNTKGNDPIRFAEERKVYSVYDIYDDGQFTWYQIGDEEWIADKDGEWVSFSKERNAVPVSNLDGENEIASFVGLPVQDITAIYGESYYTGFWKGGSYIGYETVPLLFYYDNANVENDQDPRPDSIITAVEALSDNALIFGTIRIGSTKADLESFLGYELTFVDEPGYERPSKICSILRGGCDYHITIFDDSEQIINVLCVKNE